MLFRKMGTFPFHNTELVLLWVGNDIGNNGLEKGTFKGGYLLFKKSIKTAISHSLDNGTL